MNGNSNAASDDTQSSNDITYSSLHPELTLPQWIELMDDDPIVLSVVLHDDDPNNNNTNTTSSSSSPSLGPILSPISTSSLSKQSFSMMSDAQQQQQQHQLKKRNRKDGDCFEVRASSRLLGSFFSIRTYEEFVHLHDVLAVRFPGSCLPPIPKLKPVLVTMAPAALGGKTKHEKKLYSRRHAHLLQLFLQALADHPFLRNDDAFFRFVQHSEGYDPFGLEYAKRGKGEGDDKKDIAEKAAKIRARSMKVKKEIIIKSAIKQPEAHKSLRVGESTGTIRWKEALEEAGRHMNFEHATDELKLEYEELGDHINVLNALKVAAKTQVEACKKYAESAMLVATAMEDWANRARSEAAVHVDGSRVELKSELMDCSQRTMQHANVLEKDYGAIQIERALLNTVRFEKHLCLRWRHQVENALHKSQERKRAQEVVNKIQTEVGVALEKGEPHEKIANLGKKLADAKSVLKDAEEQAQEYERGLLGWELERYRKMRAVRAERMREELMRLHFKGSRKIQAIWDMNTASSSSSLSPLSFTLGSNANSLEKGKVSSTSDLSHKKKGLLSRSSDLLKKLAFGTPPPKKVTEVKQRGVKELETVYHKKDNMHRDQDHDQPAPPGAMAKKKAPIENDKNKVTLLAKHDYEAKRDDELNLHEGEKLTAVRVDEDLWFATNSLGLCGVVPSSEVYVSEAIEEDIPATISITPRISVVGTPINPRLSNALIRTDSRISLSQDPLIQAPILPPPPPPPGIPLSPQEPTRGSRILSLQRPIVPSMPNFMLQHQVPTYESDDEDEFDDENKISSHDNEE